MSAKHWIGGKRDTSSLSGDFVGRCPTTAAMEERSTAKSVLPFALSPSLSPYPSRTHAHPRFLSLKSASTINKNIALSYSSSPVLLFLLPFLLLPPQSSSSSTSPSSSSTVDVL